jgi:hypothetical protein
MYPQVVARPYSAAVVLSGEGWEFSGPAHAPNSANDVGRRLTGIKSNSARRDTGHTVYKDRVAVTYSKCFGTVGVKLGLPTGRPASEVLLTYVRERTALRRVHHVSYSN